MVCSLGEHIYLPSESLLEFKLRNAIQISARTSAQSEPPAGLSNILTECELKYMNICGTWTWNSQGQYYSASWNNGAIAQLTVVQYSPRSISLARVDTAGASAGLTAAYTGAIFNNGTISGSVTWTWPGAPGYPTTGTWTANLQAAVDAPASSVTSDSAKLTGASIVQAIIRGGATSLELPSGQMYLYGMTTGGGAPSSAFMTGQYAEVVNASGKLSNALAYGTNNQNSYTTQTAYHDIGGVSVAGSWKHFAAYYGSNRQSGAQGASVSFQTNEDSLVVVLGLASSQQFVSVEGIPELQVDASRNGGGMLIAHAYVKPGSYTVIEHSKALAAGQDPPHMADLVGVFVFEGRQVNNQSAVRTRQLSAADIHSADFLNFAYQSSCQDGVIQVSKGEGKADAKLSFRIVKAIYGDVIGDGNEQAAVHTMSDTGGNWACNEVFVFASSPSGPKLLARLAPTDWGKGEEDNGSDYHVSDVRIDNRQLAVSFFAGGSHACPAWTVTARFQWNGSGFVRTGVSRKPFNCQTQ